MEKNRFNLIIIGLLGIVAFVPEIAIIHNQMQKQNQIKRQNRDFYRNLYSGFLENLETRDKISDLDKRTKAENMLRYEQQKDQANLANEKLK
jgi:hypothetical protein